MKSQCGSVMLKPAERPTLPRPVMRKKSLNGLASQKPKWRKPNLPKHAPTNKRRARLLFQDLSPRKNKKPMKAMKSLIHDPADGSARRLCKGKKKLKEMGNPLANNLNWQRL